MHAQVAILIMVLMQDLIHLWRLTHSTAIASTDIRVRPVHYQVSGHCPAEKQVNFSRSLELTITAFNFGVNVD